MKPRHFLLLPLLASGLSAATKTWDDANANNNWNTTDINWLGGVSFANGDTAVFAGATGETVTVAAGGVLPAATNITGNGSYAFSGGSIGGTLAKGGTGTLSLASANIFTGTTVTVSGGSLQCNTNQNFSGNFNSYRSGLVLSGGAVVQSRGTFNFDVNQNGSSSSSNVSGTGTLQLASTTNSATTPDLYFGPDHSSTSYYGAKSTSGVTLDLGSNQRFIFVKTGHNSVSNYPNDTDAQILGPIIGAGGITYIAQNNWSNMEVPLVLGGANTFSGRLEIQRGSVYLKNASALSQTNKVLMNPAAGNNARFFLYGNSTTVSNLESSGAGNPLVANGNVVNPSAVAAATLTVNQTADTTFGGVIADTQAEYDKSSGSASGKLSLTKTGANTLTLSGANTYTGTTTVNGGTLKVTGALAAGSAVTVNTGAILSGNGTAAGTVTVADGGSVTPGVAGTGVLTVGGLTLGAATANTGTLNVNLGAVPGIINATGALVVNSGANTVTVNLNGAAPALGQYRVIGYSGSIGGTGAGFAAFKLGSLPNRVIANLVNNTANHSIDINVSGVDSLLWSGSQSTEWSTNVIPGAKNWVLNSNHITAADFLVNDSVVFDDTATTTTVDISTGNISPAGVTFSNNSLHYTLTGGNAIADGGSPVSLVKTGNGILTVSNSNSFTGTVALNGGTVEAATIGNSGSAGPLGAGTAINFGGGTLSYTGASASTNRSFIANAGGGTLSVANAATTFTLAGGISGTGTFSVNGAGKIYLTSPSTLAGTLAIPGGSSLYLGSGASLGSTAVALDGTLFVDRSDSVTLGGVIGGAGSVVKQNTNTLTVGGTNTYLGGTTVNGGALTLTTGTALGSGPLAIGSAATSGTGGSTYAVYVNNTAATTLPNDIVLPAAGSATTYTLMKGTSGQTTGTQLNLTGTISGSGANTTLRLNTQTGGDTTTTYRLAGSNTLAGNIELYRGAIVVTNNNSLGNAKLLLNANNNTTLGDVRFENPVTLNNSIDLYNSSNPDPINTNGNTVVLAGVVSSSGNQGLVKMGAGTLVLAANNSYTVTTTVNGGTLQVGNGGSTGTLGSGAVTNNGALAFNRSDAIMVNNAIGGTGTIVQNGPGSTTLAGAITAVAGLTLNGGGLNLTSSVPATATLNLTDGQFSFATGANPLGTLTFASLTQSGGNLVLDVSGNLADSMTVTGSYASSAGGIIVNVGSPPSNGTRIPLVSYGTLTGTPPVTVNGLSGTRVTATPAYGTGSNDAISLTFNGNSANLVWTGTTSAAWDVTTNNWLNGAVADVFYQLDSVGFDDSATTTNPTLDFTATPGAVRFSNTASTYTLTGGGSIAGLTGITVDGGGTVVIATNNTYSGVTGITSGTLQIGAGGTTGTLGSGNVSVDGSLVFNRSDSITVANTISGSGELKQAGTGTLVLTGANAYGPTSITNGTVQVGDGGTTGTLGSAEVSDNGSLAFDHSDAITVSNVISGSGTVTKLGGSSLTLGGTNTYGGGTTVTQGTLIGGNGSAFGSGPVTVATGAAVQFKVADGSTNVCPNAIILPSNGSYQLNVLAPSSLTTVRMTGRITGGAAGQNYQLADSQAGGNHNNVLVLDNASNNFQGVIYLWRGTLGFTSDGAFGNPANTIHHDTWSLNGALRFDADNITLNPARTITLATGGYPMPLNTQGFTGTVAGAITGPGTLVKQGAGTLVLTNATNNFSGPAEVSAGTLMVNGVITTGTAAVTVDPGASLAGTGTVNRPVTVNGSISPGAATGVLTVGATTINGTLAACIDGASAGKLQVAGNLTLGANSALSVNLLAGRFTAPSYVIAECSGSLTGTLATVPQGYQVTYTATQVVLSQILGYAAWAATHANNQTIDQSFNNDGIANGIKYFMGLPADAFVRMPGLVANAGTFSITWPKDPNYAGAYGTDYVVQTSSTLDPAGYPGGWTDVPSDTVTISADSVSFTFPANPPPNSNFARLKVTGP